MSFEIQKTVSAYCLWALFEFVWFSFKCVKDHKLNPIFLNFVPDLTYYIFKFWTLEGVCV